MEIQYGIIDLMYAPNLSNVIETISLRKKKKKNKVELQ